jgi:hypothetical protein
MSRCIEYNLINSVPILYPYKNDMKFTYYPRYMIADADRLLNCFDSSRLCKASGTFERNGNYGNIVYEGYNFKYLKIEMKRSFETLNNEIKTLCYYIIFDSDFNIDINELRRLGDNDAICKIKNWIDNSKNHHYVMITTPLLQYKDTYYSIANDENISIIIHDSLDDAHVVDSLIKTNCFTLSDNLNIITGLYEKRILNEISFLTLIDYLKIQKYSFYTDHIWFFIMNRHRILNVCDNPIMFLYSNPNLLKESVCMAFAQYLIPENHIYLQSIYRKEIMFTSILSACYPKLSVPFLRNIYGNKINDKIWTNTENVLTIFYAFDTDCFFQNDFYGIFASFIKTKSMWSYWQKNKSELMKSLVSCYDDNRSKMLIDTLCPIFRLYEIGFEGVKIKKRRIRELWNDILEYCQEDEKNILDIIYNFIWFNEKLPIPYLFLCDVHAKYNMDYYTKSRMLMNVSTNYVYKNIRLYDLMRNQRGNVYHFQKNVVNKKMIYVIMCLYKKFNMFRNSEQSNDYLKGSLIIDYLRSNMKYLL